MPAVAMMQTLGPAEVIKYPRQLGITTPLPEYLSVAIGAAEGTLLEMTSAYSAFPNQGVRMAPASVLERDRSRRQHARAVSARSRTTRFAPTRRSS